jgi:uridine kinase
VAKSKSTPKERQPVLVAIAGGSGSGKSWLAEKLQRALTPQAARLAQDDFYADRSHLSPNQRARVNFDHPRAIDWTDLARVLARLSAGKSARVPCYDFTTHSRLKRRKVLEPKPVILIEGLWLLRRAQIRRMVSLSIFLECPANRRLQRRLARDMAARGRTRGSIRRQFREMVEPMNRRYVAPQAELADVVIRKTCDAREIRRLARAVRELLMADARGRVF